MDTKSAHTHSRINHSTNWKWHGTGTEQHKTNGLWLLMSALIDLKTFNMILFHNVLWVQREKHIDNEMYWKRDRSAAISMCACGCGCVSNVNICKMLGSAQRRHAQREYEMSWNGINWNGQLDERHGKAFIWAQTVLTYKQQLKWMHTRAGCKWILCNWYLPVSKSRSGLNRRVKWHSHFECVVVGLTTSLRLAR